MPPSEQTDEDSVPSCNATSAPSKRPINYHDLTRARNEYLFEPIKPVREFLVSFLNDPRDAPMVFLLFNILVTSFPAALFLIFMLKPTHHLVGFAYFIINAACYTQRFLLCLHYSEHRKPFRTNTIVGRFLSVLCPYIFVPLYGLPSGIYRIHHLVMHHCENNAYPLDLSSTEPYQRDNFLHFIFYWWRFLFAMAIELPIYTLKKRRFDLFLQATIGVLFYVVLWYFCMKSSPVATFWVLVMPFLLTSFAAMFGNWSQHVFVDSTRKQNNFALTYNLINCWDNLKSFNDGYHILHHQNSKIHWSELPSKFNESLEAHAREDALVFDGISFADVGVLVFTGQLGALADRYVNIGQPQRSKEEIIFLLKERLRPIPPSVKQN